MALFFDEYIPVSFVTDIENLVSAIPCVGQRSDFGIVGNDNLGIVGIRGRNGSAGYHVSWGGNVVHRSIDWLVIDKDIKFSAIKPPPNCKKNIKVHGLNLSKQAFIALFAEFRHSRVVG